MAKATNSDPADNGPASMRGFVVALVLLTLLGGGAGVLFGMQMAEPTSAAAPAPGEGEPATQSAAKQKIAGKHGEAKKKTADKEGEEEGPNLVTLEPIFANLAEPSDVWMRLEAALLVKPGPAEEQVLVAQLSQDLVQFLRTVKLSQLEDASGLQFLRDDLNDIVRSRSGGQVTELLVQGLIVE